MATKKENPLIASKERKLRPKTYTQEDLFEAMERVQAGDSLRGTARAYKIPTTTLMDRVSLLGRKLPRPAEQIASKRKNPQMVSKKSNPSKKRKPLTPSQQKTYTYSKTDLVEAVEKVKAGGTLRGTAKEYKMPATTLMDHVRGLRKSFRKGPPPVMPLDLENMFATKIIQLKIDGFRVTDKLIMEKAAEFCRRAHVPHPFKDKPAGHGWLRNFKKRHPDMYAYVQSKAQVQKDTNPSYEKVSDYFKSLGPCVNNVHSTCIWQMDASPFYLKHLPLGTLMERRTKIDYISTFHPSKNQVTVLACGNASGVVMPPMFAVEGDSYEALSPFNLQDSPADSIWTWRDRGCLAAQWFQEVFLPQCGPQRPQVLLMAQLQHQDASNLVRRARANDIQIVFFPPNSNPWLKPLDQSFFSSLYKNYYSEYKDSIATSENYTIDKASFTCLFAKAWVKTCAVTKDIKAGFEMTGIHPFQPGVILSEQFGEFVNRWPLRSDTSNNAAIKQELPEDAPLPKTEPVSSTISSIEDIVQSISHHATEEDRLEATPLPVTQPVILATGSFQDTLRATVANAMDSLRDDILQLTSEQLSAAILPTWSIEQLVWSEISSAMDGLGEDVQRLTKQHLEPESDNEEEQFPSLSEQQRQQELQTLLSSMSTTATSSDGGKKSSKQGNCGRRKAGGE